MYPELLCPYAAPKIRQATALQVPRPTSSAGWPTCLFGRLQAPRSLAELSCDVDCQRIGLLKPAQSLGKPAEYAASLMCVKGSRGLCDSSLDRALGERRAVDARKLLMQALM